MPAVAKALTYHGVYRHGVDDKRRAAVPYRWRGPKAELWTLIVWPKHSAGICLRALPPQQADKLLKEIDAMPSNDPKKSVLKRFIGSQSVQVPLDSAGRLSIPEDLASKANIVDQAVLVGMVDKFEIWSPERYQVAETTDSIKASEAFAEME